MQNCYLVHARYNALDLTDVESLIPRIFNYAKDPFGFKALEKAVDFAQEWSGQPEVGDDISNLTPQVIDKLLNAPGMTQARQTNFKRAAPRAKLKDGTIIKTFKNPRRLDCVFLAIPRKE